LRFPHLQIYTLTTDHNLTLLFSSFGCLCAVVARQSFGRSAPRVASTVPMSIVIVVASCASGVALVLILIGVAGAVRCRRAAPRHRHPTSSKRLPVTTGSDLSPFDAAVDRDGDLCVSATTVDLVDCVTRQSTAAKHRQGRVAMNGVKTPAGSRKCSDQSSVCTRPAPSGPDLAGGRLGVQPDYGSISVTGASLGAHKTRGR